MLIIFSGSSGSGKNTIIKEIIKNKPHVKVMKSCTTRKKRDDNDNAYYFLTKEEFDEKIKNDELYEFEEVHKGLFYGVLKKSLEDVKGEDIFMKDVDVNGAMKLKKELKENAKLVFLDVPKDVLMERILSRGESVESANLRLSRYDYERRFLDEYDLVIKNEDVDNTVKKIIDEFKI